MPETNRPSPRPAAAPAARVAASAQVEKPRSAESASADVRAVCYVIMPFSQTAPEHTEEYWRNHFERFLRRIVEDIPGVGVKRSTPLRGDIVREIITDLVISDVVIAELTDDNPNVFWELGVRQSFKHGSITICEGPRRLPFDIGAKGTLFYNPKDHVNVEAFRTQLQKAIRDCLQNPNIADSHVLETISGRGTLFEIFRRDETRRRLAAVLSEIQQNERVLKWVSERAEKNQADPAKRTISTSRFRTSATELVITTRYLEESMEFFDNAEVWLDAAVRLNEQLNAWEHSANSTEQWLMKVKESNNQRLQQYKTLMEAARKKLEVLT